MSETSPRMNGEPETPLDRSRRLVAALMPFGLPAYELAGDLQLVGVNLRTLTGHLDVLHEKIYRIHPDRRRRILERRHRDQASLRMTWSPPCSLAADVVDDHGVLLALVRNVEDVRKRR